MLEEKLKVHIKREFDLGEKVISLLRQKKQLETSLQKQLQAQEGLKKELETVLQSEESFERKFIKVQEELQERQQTLQKRSQIIVTDEENSRETLEHLRWQIHVLKEQLEVLDRQKIAEQNQLLQKIRELRQKEKTLSSQLQEHSHEQGRIETQLRQTMKNFQNLSHKYKKERKHYEQQIKSMRGKQIGLESEIETLFEKQKINENTLRSEVEILRITKAQLERKVEQLQQKKRPASPEFDAELLMVIDKQEGFIEEIREKAHKRSTLLKSENENLREEMQTILDEQEKIRWENQMLESSLKGLQGELGEYIQIKEKFEDIQQEKKHVEDNLRRKVKFFEPDKKEDGKNGQTRGRNQKSSVTKKPLQEQKTELAHTVSSSRQHIGRQRAKQKPSVPSVRQISPQKKIRWWNRVNISKGMLLNALLLVVAIVLAIAIYRLMPWEYIRPKSSSAPQRFAVEQVEKKSEIRTIKDDELLLEGQAEQTEAHFAAALSQKQEVSLPDSKKAQSLEIAREAQESSEVIQNKEIEPVTPSLTQQEHERPMSKRPVDIVVKLTHEQVNRFTFQAQEPFPTIANNSILRRHYEQKLTAFRQ